MATIPFDSDATRAAVTAAAHAIAAYCDREGIAITPEQCEDLAERLVSNYLAFNAGIRFATRERTSTDPVD